MNDKQPHHGRNIKRIREIQGMKQEALAIELGEDWNQKKISLLESKETLDAELLAQVAKALHVTPEAIENFDEDGIINIVSTTFHSHDQSTSVAYQSSFTFNPIDKIVELYEALLKEKEEKISLLQKMTKEK